MEILTFKTTISDDIGIAHVSSLLRQEPNLTHWKVDTAAPENLLTVSGREVDPQRIINLVGQAGFEAEFIQVIGASGGGL